MRIFNRDFENFVNISNEIHLPLAKNFFTGFREDMRVNRLENYNKNIAFGAMKKSQFKGIDRMIVEQYKAPIQKFNEHSDFQKFCKNLVKEITKQNYFGRSKVTEIQRRNMLKEWFEYVTKENEAYTDSIALMILKAVTKNLKKDDDTLPPVLNKGILANTVEDVQQELTNNEKQSIDFYKAYVNNLQKRVTEDYGLSKDQTGWIIIPSLKHDPENFNENVAKLKTLSHPSWCTKSYNAQPYLSNGDFHIYIENGKPALGVRFYDNEIQEIQGPDNDGTIPLRYYKVANHFKNYDLSYDAEKELSVLSKKMNKVKLKFPKGIDNYSSEEILKKCGIKCRRDSDGMLIISKLKSPYKGLSFWDIGVNLNKLLKEVKEIEGDADFKGASSFGNVRVIGGHGNIYKTDVKHIGKLEYAGKGLSFSDFDKEHAKIMAELKPRMINYIHKNFFPKGVENYSTQEILERFGIKCKKDSDGMLIISEYHQPLDNYREHITYSELGIDENKLLMDIKKIEYIADMSKSNATSLGNVKEVYSLILSDSAIRDISGLDYASWNIVYDYYGTNRASDEEIEAAKKRSRETFMKRNFPKGIENYSPKEILKKFGFKCHKKMFGKNRGKLVLSNFNGPISPLWDITKMGIDKDKLIENIIKIKKNASGGYENILLR